MSNSKCVGHWFLKKVIKGLVLCEFCCIHCAVHFLFSIASLSSPFTSCFLLFHCAPCSLFVFYYFTELAVHFSFSVTSLSSPFTSCFLLLHWVHCSLLVFYYFNEFTSCFLLLHWAHCSLRFILFHWANWWRSQFFLQQPDSSQQVPKWPLNWCDKIYYSDTHHQGNIWENFDQLSHSMPTLGWVGGKLGWRVEAGLEWGVL